MFIFFKRQSPVRHAQLVNDRAVNHRYMPDPPPLVVPKRTTPTNFVAIQSQTTSQFHPVKENKA